MAEPLKYDQILYPSATSTVCHCRRHEAVARLFGLDIKPLATARVLEVGCGDGWSLLPQAEQYPEAQFVGFDYARRPIEAGKQVIADLGLSNVELRHADIMSIDATWGEFDYVVAHGFYSWVPPQVQVKFLSLLGDLLAPQGVAYLSYNVLPGWRTRQTVRDLMLFQTQGVDDDRQRIAQARQALDLLVSGATSTDYRSLLEQEQDMVQHRPDGYLFHDHLAEINEAYYFTDMLQRWSEADLQYLGETELDTMYPADIPAEVRKKLDPLSLEASEQLLDFMRNREFRSSLVCREGVKIDRDLNAQRLLPFHVALATETRCSSENLSTETPFSVAFEGRELELPDPRLQAAMLQLASAYPGGYSCQELLSRTRTQLEQASLPAPTDPAALAQSVLGFLWHLATMGLVELSIHEPPLRAKARSQPTASRTARYQAQQGAAHATNQKHRSVWLEPIMRRILSLCDGQRSQQELIDTVSREIEAGEIEGTPPTMGQMQVVAVLDRLAKESLLVK